MTLVHHEDQIQQNDVPVPLLLLNVSKVTVALGLLEETPLNY